MTDVTAVSGSNNTTEVTNVNNTNVINGVSPKYNWIYSWREIWAISSAIAFFMTVAVVLSIMVYSVYIKDETVIPLLAQILSPLVLLFGVPGTILGIHTYQQGRIDLANINNPGN